jgi:hypothetical protein
MFTRTELCSLQQNINENFTSSNISLFQGFVDTKGYRSIDSYAQRTKAALDAGNYELATDLWGTTETIILIVTGGIDFYNVLFPVLGKSKAQHIFAQKGKYDLPSA